MNAIQTTASLEAGRREAGQRAFACFRESGAVHIEPPILQPTAAFLDMSGEEIRGRLYLTTDGTGSEICLRPDYTIPVCLAHLAGSAVASPAQYAYFGPIFRARPPGQRGEMIQTGLESYGRNDIEAADAEILSLALEAAARAGVVDLAVRIGDVRVFDGVIDALGLPAVWRRRIRRGLAQGKPLAALLNAAGPAPSTQSGVLAALERSDHAGAQALVEDFLAIAGISAVGGRDVRAIADRFLQQASQREEGRVSEKQQAVLTQFLRISTDPDRALRALRELAQDAKLSLDAQLGSFEERIGFIASRGVNVENLRYDAGFVRDLDYYTGFVFEAVADDEPTAAPAVVGGRYDGLARRMGASSDLPAVGAAIWIDRLPLRECKK